MTQATLFIPDISGFTKFVKLTEINHGKHIIEELINLIIKEGSNYFKVAEIEGDAVFFYTQNKLRHDQLMKATRQIFLAFHQHLLKYEHQRICNCGACQGAVNLMLKFIVHQGDIEMVKFNKQQSKPYGAAVIAVHRLLKNNIDGTEYILFSEKYLDNSPLRLDGSGSIEDAHLGVIPFKFKMIDHWKNDLETVESVSHNLIPDIQIEVKKVIDLNSDLLLQLISDFRFRHFWDQESSIVYNDSEINQSGTEHHCTFDGKNYDYETIKPFHEQYELSYGEALRKPKTFKHFEYNFFLNPISSEHSELALRLKASFRWKIQRLWKPVLKGKFKTEANDTIESLKKSIPEFLKHYIG